MIEDIKQHRANQEGTIAIYPYFIMGKKQVGFGAGWWSEEHSYSIQWGNFKTRESANEGLKKEYPKCKIINLDYQPVVIGKNKEPIYEPKGELDPRLDKLMDDFHNKLKSDYKPQATNDNEQE